MADARKNMISAVELLAASGCSTLDEMLHFQHCVAQLFEAGNEMTDQSGAPASIPTTAPQTVILLTDVYSKLGKLEARQDASDLRLIGLEQMLKDQLKALQEGMDKIDKKVDDLTGTQAAFKGGWKALAILGTLVVTMGTIFSWVADHWSAISGILFKG